MTITRASFGGQPETELATDGAERAGAPLPGMPTMATKTPKKSGQTGDLAQIMAGHMSAMPAPAGKPQISK